MTENRIGTYRGKVKPRTSRRQDRGRYDPIAEGAAMLANRAWEAAGRIAAALAPEVPMDMEPMDPHDSWLLLEAVAVGLPVEHWDDPAALNDLYDLRKKFMPDLASDRIKALAKLAETNRRLLPDPNVTPENPLFAKQKARLLR